MSSGVEYGALGPLRQALAEATRTDESNAVQILPRFVELRPGIQDTLGARRHHLISGRRGTGKSTLLHLVRKRLREDGAPVAVVDMEKFKGRPFPDVLIEILIVLLKELTPTFRFSAPFRSFGIRGKLRRTRGELEELLNDPQSLSKKLERGVSRGVRKSGSARARAGVAEGPVDATLAVEAAKGSESRASVTATAEFEELKIERLQQIANRLSSELVMLVKSAPTRQAVIFIDDFYFVRIDDQAAVLDYLHQVIKNTGIWLKIGGLGTRMRPFRDGDPPLGMQPDQDIDPLTIDVTLRDFSTAQRFLERMMDGILEPLALSTSQLFTDTARTRMVLACGGAVARDYVTLTSAAIDAAVERLSKQSAPKAETRINIQAEDVNLAARQRVNKKEDEELSRDAGADAQRLRERWRDICDFTREQGNSAFVLVRQHDLDVEDWGSEIRQLENLRLLHRIKDAVPNTPNWRGVKVVVYMVDLGQVAVQRLRTGIAEFWKGVAEFDKLRRAEWVYGPDWHSRRQEARRSDAAGQQGAEGTPLVLFEDPSDLD